MLRKICGNLVYIPSLIRREHGICNTARKTCRVLFYEGLNGVSLRLRTFKAQKEAKSGQSIPEKKNERKTLTGLLKFYQNYSGSPRFFLRSRIQDLSLNWVDSDFCAKKFIVNGSEKVSIYISEESELELLIELLEKLKTFPVSIYALNTLRVELPERFRDYRFSVTHCENEAEVIKNQFFTLKNANGLSCFLDLPSLKEDINLLQYLRRPNFFRFLFSNENYDFLILSGKDAKATEKEDLSVGDFLLRAFSLPTLGSSPKERFSFISRRGFSDIVKKGIEGDSRLESCSRRFNFYTWESLILKLMLTGFFTVQEAKIPDSVKNFTFFEEQLDFSKAIKDKSVKVLAYYLPQFHPTKENDEWHGKGFTEWTKVSQSECLFEGHYQPHIPIKDLGYYHIEDAQILKKQSDLMKKAGIDGLLFYHYWFGGKLILERPAQILRDDKDIDLPFAFCWANENWTKRWDGNEAEVLLAQNYSVKDAEDFIDYLIPFFKDKRYIKINGRPFLAIYRPSHNPLCKEYIETWRRICIQAGLAEPFVAVVMTRDAKEPKEYGADIAIERPLHDWTDGAVKTNRVSLNFFAEYNGNSLNFEEVANFYSRKALPEFPMIRSVVPSWDNTARYGKNSYLLTHPDPAIFQKWFSEVLEKAKCCKTEGERLIVINAWNEWAEGNHLEPDEKYGHAYLNAIGRSRAADSPMPKIQKMTKLTSNVVLRFSDELLQVLQSNEALKNKYLNNLLKNLREATTGEIYSNVEGNFVSTKDGHQNSLEDCIYIDLRKISFQTGGSIFGILSQALLKKGKLVVPDFHTRNYILSQLVDFKAFFEYVRETPFYASTDPEATYEQGVSVALGSHSFVRESKNGIKNPGSDVAVIIRIHDKADFKLFSNTLASLLAVSGCVVKLHIACQNLGSEKLQQLNEILFGNIVWDIPPQLHLFNDDSIPDLRSLMLNETIRRVDSRYAVFLDYDDWVFSDSYSWLVDRLKSTGKAATFGRVFKTVVSSISGRVMYRTKPWESGKSYTEFLEGNFLPLHSIMFDLERINLNSVKYFPFHPYMEDYYFLLQVVDEENADWESLNHNFYIGDYCFRVNGNNTLAVDEKTCQLLEASDDYQQCLKRVQDMVVNLRQM